MAFILSKLNVKHAQKLITKSFVILGEVLAFIGKPFYLLLSHLLISSLLISYAIGFVTRQILGLVISLILIGANLTKSLLSRFTSLILSINLKGKRKQIKEAVRKILKNLSKNYKPPLTTKKKHSKRAGYIYLTSFLLLILIPFLFWLLILKDLPSPEKLVTRDIDISTKIYDRNGIVLYKIYKNKNRTLVPLSLIPMNVRLATLAIEDAEFYQHPGFSLRGIVRATIRNIKRGEVTGGSTITQQLVKNALLSPEKTLERKLREIILAVKVEISFSKDQILEMYLNEVAYGGTSYGIQEAAQTYFAKDTQDLTLAEAALLAGLPKSPTNFSPFGPNPKKAKARQKEVLRLMEINKYITHQQREKAENEPLKFAKNKTEIKAPHFVMFIRQELEKSFGKEVVEKGGLEVITTLDYQIQQLAEKVVAEEVAKLARLNVGNGAALVMNPQTGEVLAMVGSINYFDTQSDGNVNVTTSLRQPGSSIKVVNYAYALSNGLTPATIIADTPVKFKVEGQSIYSPRNYDGSFRGNITLRSALAESRNVPAVKVLSKYGVVKMIEMGRRMGITSWEKPSNYGLSLTLGGGEVKLVDLSLVYSTLANYGKRPALTFVKKVINHKGKILANQLCRSKKRSPSLASLQTKDVKAKTTGDQVCESEQILDPRVAYLITDILKDNGARAPAFGNLSLLNVPGHKEVAVKTGTSNDLRDNLAVGYSQDYLVAVWVGNNDNSPMARIASGVTGATPIFNKIMRALLSNKPNHPWDIPEGLVALPVCTTTGTLTCQGCPSTRMEWFLKENAPAKACLPEWFAKRENDDKKEGTILEEAARDFRQ